MAERNSVVRQTNQTQTQMDWTCLLYTSLGVGLHHFVMNQIQVDMVSFKYVIKPTSFLLTVALVLLFSIITDLILRRKIARIDMAESLKSIE